MVIGNGIVGTYKNKKVYQVTSDEYIENGYYKDKDNYFIISNETYRSNGKTWNLMVCNNMVTAACTTDHSQVDSDIRQRPYYFEPTIGVNTAKKVVAQAPSIPTVETGSRNEFDVDEFLSSPHSVDKYLEEVKNAIYS